MGDRYIFKMRWSRSSRVVMLVEHAQGLSFNPQHPPLPRKAKQNRTVKEIKYIRNYKESKMGKKIKKKIYTEESHCPFMPSNQENSGGG